MSGKMAAIVHYAGGVHVQAFCIGQRSRWRPEPAV